MRIRISFAIIAILSIASLSLGKNNLKTIEISMESEALTEGCELLSHIISVDTKKDNYDLLMSLSTNADCDFKCFVSQAKGKRINAVKIETDHFFDQNYYFFKFQSLLNYEKYSLTCTQGKSDKKGSSGTIFSNIQFPKSKQTTRLIAFGDWCKSEDGSYTRKYVEEKSSSVDAVLLLGDQAYNFQDNEGHVGNDYMEFIKPVSSKIPFQITPGNHDNHNDYEHYIKRFIMPNKKQTKNLYYSFDINNAHIVSLNSEIPYDFNASYKSDFQDWLSKDLKSSNKKWKIIYLHRPLYCSFESDYHCGSSADKMRELVEEILMENKVDLILAGHVHAYQRLYPLYEGKIDFKSMNKDRSVYTNPKYPVHVVCGAAGNDNNLYPVNHADYSHVDLSEVGVCEVNITQDKIEIRFINTHSRIVKDKFSIVKK